MLLLPLSSADFFNVKKNISGTLSEFQTTRVSNSLDTDHDRQNVGPDLGPNCLQRLSAATEVASSKGQYSKSLVHICKIGCEIIG